MARRRKTDARGGPGGAGPEAGFTLVELMASLTLLAVGIVGVIGVMNSSFQVVNTATARSRATAVATKWIEQLRSHPYDVSLAVAEANATGDYVEAEQPPVGGQQFTVNYALTRHDEVVPDAEGNQQDLAYVKAVVWVNWTDSAGPHDIYQTTLIYPGGRGVHDAAELVQPGANNNTAPAAPQNLTATPVTGSSAVDLVWEAPPVSATVPVADSWVVQYSGTSAFLPGDTQEVAGDIPGSVTTLRLTDLAEGTEYHFRVFAKSEDGVLSQEAATASTVTLTSGSVNCSVGAASVTPSAVKKQGGNAVGKLVVDPRVEVQLLGDCATSTFQIEYSPQDGVVVTRSLAPVAGRPGTLKATIDGTSNAAAWVVGDRPIDVYSYSPDKRIRANMRLLVCDHGRANCP